MNKKVILSLVAVLICCISLFAVKSIKNKDAVQGNKNITIEIISEADNLKESNEVTTDKVFLGQVVSEENGYKTENGMITSIKNVDLKNSKTDYWHIYVNGEDAQVGVNEIAIKDGDVIKFERKSFV